MSIYVNATNRIINLMVNGSRKSIYPNQTVHGPDSLGSIPGMKLVVSQTKTILKPLGNKPQYTETTKQHTNNTNINRNSENKNTIFSKQIKNEIEYHKHMNSLDGVPSVSIAILTKDSYDLITNCCSSLLQKIKYKNTTIVICDTGTTDNNVKKYYKQLEKECKHKNFNFKLIQLKNYHFSQNYNEVVKHIDTEFFLIQNNDTEAINDYVTKMMKLAIFNKVGSVGPRMFYKDGRIQHDGQHIYQQNGFHQMGTCGHLNIGLRKNQLNPIENGIKLVDGNTAAGCLLRTSDFKQVKGFDENYKDIFQDVDLMIKIPQLTNRFNYCDRSSEIYHIDNASRFSKGKDPSRWQSMRMDTLYLKSKCDKLNWSRKLPYSVDFSIITLSYKINDYEDLLKSFEIQEGNHTVEFIGIPNYQNIYTSAYEAFNKATEISSGKYIVYIHDDVIVTPTFLKDIKSSISKLTNNEIAWGVLGPAGVHINTNFSEFYLIDENGKKISGPGIQNEKQFVKVDSLDELCLITERSKNIKFSETVLSGMHFYGVDLCTQGQLRKLNTYAIKAFCHHKSDGSKNLSNKEKFNEYLELLMKWKSYSRSLNITKWRTTTVACDGNNVYVFSIPDKYKEHINHKPIIIPYNSEKFVVEKDF